MSRKKYLRKPVIPDTPDKAADGYMGALMTVHDDDEELLYAGTGTKNNRDFSATDEGEQPRGKEDGNAQD